MMEPSFISLTELGKLIDPEFVKNNKIEFIKQIRRMTGEGLKEVNNFINDEWIPVVVNIEKPEKPSAPVILKTHIEIIRRIENLEAEVSRLSKTESKKMTINLLSGE